MRRGLVAMVAVGLTLMSVLAIYARPPIGRSGQGPGSRLGNGPGNRSDNGPGPGGQRSNVGDDIRSNNVIDRVVPNNVNEKINNGDLRGAVEEHIGVLPTPKQPNAVRNNVNNNRNINNARNINNVNTANVRAPYAAANQPFTAGWYTNHPNAWQYTHPRANAWAVATLAGTTAWLGWGTVPVNDYSSYYSETPADVVSQEATAIVDNGTLDVPSDGEWLNLGTYTLAPNNQADATVILTLAVNKQGVIRGNYYDLLSNSVQIIYGSIDKASQRVAWRAGAQGPVTFQTTLSDLTSTITPVSLQFENGKTVLWNLVRQKS